MNIIETNPRQPKKFGVMQRVGIGLVFTGFASVIGGAVYGTISSATRPYNDKPGILKSIEDVQRAVTSLETIQGSDEKFGVELRESVSNLKQTTNRMRVYGKVEIDVYNEAERQANLAFNSEQNLAQSIAFGGMGL